MTIDEIKAYIKELAGSVNENNAQGIAAELAEISQSIADQFNSAAFRKEMQQFANVLTREIEEADLENQKINTDVTQNKSLLDQKEQINRKYSELEIRRSEVRTLEIKLAELISIDEQAMEANILSLKETSAASIKVHISALDKLNDLLGNTEELLENVLKENIGIAKANLVSIENNLTAILGLLSHKPLQEAFAGFAKGYDDLVVDYNKYVIKITEIKADLEKISKEHDTVQSEFAAHQMDNEKIYGVLSSREGVLTYVELLNKDIKDRLEKYDQEIRILVEKRDQLPIYELKDIKAKK